MSRRASIKHCQEFLFLSPDSGCFLTLQVDLRGPYSLGHVQALDAVAVDAVVERRMLQRRLRLQLLHNTAGLLSSLPLPWGEI